MVEERVRVRYDLEDNASKGLGGILGSLKNLFSPTALVAAAVAGLGVAIGGMIRSAEESRQVMAQTEAVIKSTGGAAGVSADQVTAYAQAISQASNFDDEAIQSGENLLLTFTKIGKDVFPQATQTMVDMSAALGQDLKGSAIQLGKALNDPITGMTALKRVGVSFDESQVEMVKNMVAAGNQMGAQQLILAELKKEFGGVAAATASPFTILQNTLGNVSEALGSKLLPFARMGALGLNDLANSFIKFVDKIDISSAVLSVMIWWEELKGQTKKTFEVIKDLIRHPFTWETYKGALKLLVDNIGATWDIIKSIFSKGFSAAKSLITQFFADTATNAIPLAKRLEAIEAETKKNIEKLKEDFAATEKKINAQRLQNAKETDVAIVASTFTTFEQAMSAHEAYISGLEASNTYSFQAEINRLNQMLATYSGNAEAKAKITVKLNGVITKSNEKQAEDFIRAETAAIDRKKALGELSVADEIAANQAMLENKLLTDKQKEDIGKKLNALETQDLVDKQALAKSGYSEEQKWLDELNEKKKKGLTDQLAITNIMLESARKAGNEKLSLEKQIANGMLDMTKKRIIAEVDAEASKWVNSGVGHLMMLNPYGFLEIAAGALLSSGVRSALSGIQLAEGGIVMPRPGGTQATIGEAGQAEAVIPLGDPRARAMMGGGGGIEEIFLNANGTRILAKAIYRDQQYLQRTGQIGTGLI